MAARSGWRGARRPAACQARAARQSALPGLRRGREQAGFRLTDDYNGASRKASGRWSMTIWQGRRWSAANAYLSPALKRPNLDSRPRHRAPSDRLRRAAARPASRSCAADGSRRITRAARGDPRGLLDQLAEAADAVGHRPGRASCGARHRRRGRPPGRRRQSAGPSGALRPAGMPCSRSRSIRS